MSLNILVVEDNGEKLRQIAEFLGSIQGLNCEIRHVADAAAARAEIERNRYDVLIADLVIPRMPGEHPTREAGRELLDSLFESEDANMPTQIIGLSAYPDDVALESRWFSDHAIAMVRFESKSDGWKQPLNMRLRQTHAAKLAMESAPVDYETHLGIICALDDEFAAVRRLPWDWSETSVPGDPSIYVKGSLPTSITPNDVILTLTAEMGMSAAAIAATKLVHAYHPRFLAIVGITAGMPDRTQLGDVIAAEECWDWGMGKYEVDDGKLVFHPSPRQLGVDASMRSALRRLKQDQSALDKIRDLWPAAPPSTALRLLMGPVASGSAVIAATEMTERLTDHHRKLLAVEMETYGVFAAASESILPRPSVLSIKGVSDFADEEKDDRVRHYACYAAASVLRTLFENHM